MEKNYDNHDKETQFLNCSVDSQFKFMSQFEDL